MVAGFVYVIIGISYITAEATPSRTLALKYALDRFPMEVWGVLFVLAGLMAIVSSRWPPISKTWGYIVLTSLSVIWALFYLAGVIFNDASNSLVSGVGLWGLNGFLWWAISGLVNPEDVLAAREEA